MSNQTETAPRWHELTVATDGTLTIDRQALEEPGTDPFTAALGIFAAAAKDSGAGRPPPRLGCDQLSAEHVIKIS